MIHNLVLLSGLIVSTTCMVLHQATLPVFLPVRYHEPDYNFAYEVNDARTGDFKRQQETRRGGTVLGQYSLLQPDGITRTVEYRADDDTGFNAVVKNEGRPNNVLPDKEEDKDSEGSDSQASDRPQDEQAKQSPNDQQVTTAPLAVAHTALIHRSYTGLPNPWDAGVSVPNPWI